METKGFGEYRSFSKAAKESGMVDKDERKLAGMEPELLLEDASREVREDVAPEMLVSFLRTLQGQKDADPRHVLEIGNALYRYRSDSGRNAVRLNEKEERLVGLACRLVENAFYDGRLDDLNEGQAASVAFVANVTAKLLQQGNNQSQTWYDAGKFDRFRREVEDFKNGQLAEMFAFKDPGMTVQEAITMYEKEIGEELDRVNGIVDNLDWGSALSDVQNRIDTALTTLCDSENMRRHTLAFDRFQSSFDQQMTNTGKVAEFARREVRSLEERLRSEDVSYRTFGNFSDFLFQATRPDDGVSRPGGYFDRARTAADLYRRRKEIIGTDESSKKAKTMTDFSALRQSIAERKVPEAFDALGAIFEPMKKADLGKMGELIQGVDSIGQKLRKRNALRSCERAFAASAESLMKSAIRPAGIPYFIKSYLIAVSLLKGWDENPRMGFNKLTKIDVYSSSGTENGTDIATHDFFDGSVSAKRDDRQSDRMPAYHVLHYKTNEVPFAVWSAQYLRSKMRGSVSREISSVRSRG